jgi:hypothetical protein
MTGVIALLVNYIAGSFVVVDGDTLVTEAQTERQPPECTSNAVA